jgi:hypothetical protein
LIQADDATGITLSAGCNSSIDNEVLQQLSKGLAAELGGTASEPRK